MADFRAERERIGELLEKVLRQYLADAGVPPVNDTYEYVLSDQGIGKYPSAREMRFFLEDLAAFTPELANRLRDRVLSRFKSWTLVPQYAEMTFTVHADGVRFGRRKVQGPISEATEDYQAWLRAARRYDEERKGEVRRQVRRVVPLIQAAIPSVGRHRYAVLAAFQIPEAPERKEDTVVWVLTEGGAEEPHLSPGATFKQHAVTAGGAVEPAFCGKYWPTTDLPTPFFLLAHAFRWRDRRRLMLTLHPGEEAEAKLGPIEVGEQMGLGAR